VNGGILNKMKMSLSEVFAMFRFEIIHKNNIMCCRMHYKRVEYCSAGAFGRTIMRRA
jgi:hypothetical protein